MQGNPERNQVKKKQKESQKHEREIFGGIPIGILDRILKASLKKYPRRILKQAMEKSREDFPKISQNKSLKEPQDKLMNESRKKSL